MADYFTHFSCLFDVGTAENAARALQLYSDTPPDEYERQFSEGFQLSISSGTPTNVWIYDESSGDVEPVIEFVLLCAKEFDLKGRWGFEYANTCSRPRLDAFGGGAHIVDLSAREAVGWVSTNEWLTRTLAGDDSDA